LVAKYHDIIVNKHTEMIAFLCRVINFLEDIVEDAECSEVYVDRVKLSEMMLEFKAIGCKYDVVESTRLFSDKHGIKAELGSGDMELRKLYDRVVDYYARTLRKEIKQYAIRTRETGIEYYLGVLFDGRGFIAEGEEDKVIVPGLPQCFSAHTHPSDYPMPSLRDIRVITRLLVDRGLGHVVETFGNGLAIYRTGPVSLSDYEVLLNTVKKGDVENALREMINRTVVKARFI
jgi:hypothetical protein